MKTSEHLIRKCSITTNLWPRYRTTNINILYDGRETWSNTKIIGASYLKNAYCKSQAQSLSSHIKFKKKKKIRSRCREIQLTWISSILSFPRILMNVLILQDDARKKVGEVLASTPTSDQAS